MQKTQDSLFKAATTFYGSAGDRCSAFFFSLVQNEGIELSAFWSSVLILNLIVLFCNCFADRGPSKFDETLKNFQVQYLHHYKILNVIKEMGKEFNEKIGVLTGQIQTLSKTLIDALSNAKSDPSESLDYLIEFNPELLEDPIMTEDLSKTNPDLSKTEVAKDDCRDGCKDKAYFYDEGIDEKPNQNNEIFNVLKHSI